MSSLDGSLHQDVLTESPSDKRPKDSLFYFFLKE